MLNTSSTKH